MWDLEDRRRRLSSKIILIGGILSELNGPQGLILIPRSRSDLSIAIRSLDLVYKSLVWVTPKFWREPTWCKPPWFKGAISLRGRRVASNFVIRIGLAMCLLFWVSLVSIEQSSICFQVYVSNSLRGRIISHPTSK